MKDINPIRRTIPIAENNDPKDQDLRASAGILNSASESSAAAEQDFENEAKEVDLPVQVKSSTVLVPREEMAFSSLYTPESRRNTVPMDQQRTKSQPTKYPPLRTAKTSKKKILSILLASVIVIHLCFFKCYG